MSDRVHLLVSPDAGRGRADSADAAVRAELTAAGVEIIDLTGDTAADSAAAAQRAAADGAERIVVVGGDGLVHLALQAVATTETALGVVPVGTGNDFVRGLSGFAFDEQANDPARAARAALGPVSAIDAIRVGPESDPTAWVASVATAGFSGDVNDRANRLRRPRGPSRYTVATVLEIPTLTRRPLQITADGVTTEFDTALIAVANTGWFGGGMQICPGADPADGQLDVTVVAGASRLEMLRFFRLVFNGRHLEHPKVHTLRGAIIEITGADVALWGDGEPVGNIATTLTAVPSALRIAGLG